MLEEPKTSKKYMILYFFLGLFLGLIVDGLASAVALIAQYQIVTFDTIVQLHLSYPQFLIIDGLILFGTLLWAWVGLEKDRAGYSKKYAEWLSQNHQLELNQLQESQSEKDKKYQEEIQQRNQQISEQDQKHQAEVLLLSQQLNEQGEKFQNLEAIIRRGKQQWEGTFDAVDDPIVLADESGCILRCNRVTGEVFQLGYSQIIGRQIDDLFSNAQEAIPGKKDEIHLPQFGIWYEVSKNHLLIDGKQEGWVYFFRNITAQKQAMQEQQRLTQYYELLVKNSPVAIATLNLEDRIVDCNPAFEKLFLFTKRESLGWKADLLVSPPDMVFENHRLAEAVRNGETVRKISQGRRKDGSLVDIEVYGIPVVLGGKQVGSLVLYHDVTELVHSKRGVPEGIQPASAAAAGVLAAKVVEEAFSEQPEPAPEAAVDEQAEIAEPTEISEAAGLEPAEVEEPAAAAEEEAAGEETVVTEPTAAAEQTVVAEQTRIAEPAAVVAGIAAAKAVKEALSGQPEPSPEAAIVERAAVAEPTAVAEQPMEIEGEAVSEGATVAEPTAVAAGVIAAKAVQEAFSAQPEPAPEVPVADQAAVVEHTAVAEQPAIAEAEAVEEPTTTAEQAAVIETVPAAEPEAVVETEPAAVIEPAEAAEQAAFVEPAAVAEQVEAPEAVEGAVLKTAEEAEAIPAVAAPARKRAIPVEMIEGIGPVFAQKLLAIGVKTTEELLELGKSRKGREELVEKTGISATLILKWVNMADLMRVHGIGEEYSELLEKAGVDTVKELRNRNPNHLYEALLHQNELHKLVRRVPHLSEVENWIKEAKELDPIMTY